MGISIYSFQGSKIHLKMDDIIADGYNRAINSWFKAQEDFEKVHGRKVTAKEIMDGKMLISANEADVICYNRVCQTMNKLYDEGLELNEEDCPSNYLVKL